MHVASPLLEGAGTPYRLADPLRCISQHYAAVVIDTRPSFSLLTEVALIASTDAIVPVEPHYLETVGLMNVMSKINELREGWQHPNLNISGLLVTKMDTRVRGHNHLLEELKFHPVLGPLLIGVIPTNDAVSYAHHNHQRLFRYDPKAPSSKAYAQLVGKLVQYSAWRRVVLNASQESRNAD